MGRLSRRNEWVATAKAHAICGFRSKQANLRVFREELTLTNGCQFLGIQPHPQYAKQKGCRSLDCRKFSWPIRNLLSTRSRFVEVAIHAQFRSYRMYRLSGQTVGQNPTVCSRSSTFAANTSCWARYRLAGRNDSQRPTTIPNPTNGTSRYQ